MPISVGDYVSRKGESQPIGIVTDVYGRISAKVRWGIQDGDEFTEDLNIHDLVLVTEEIKNKLELPEPEVVAHNVFAEDEPPGDLGSPYSHP